ncbi:hypothetical protein HYN56_09825 [Flavobacterium crocinum]|uniref:Exo-alpha-sialidase n=1 Tax=Flavobacterium crocinum TaxID=2183896 RepID=A0A2S1YKF2_9FLAO|nr:hypothetical protein [Flavobacterium crocinum]AWK04513.1 hypothetical protein HYN56_09825 [Flavobacterium crocinum]
MKKLLMCLLVMLIAIGCKDFNENNLKVEIIDFNGMKGKSEYMYFINPKEGYSFNYITESKEQTEEQLNDPDFFPESTDIASIYKTTDGGQNWKKVTSIENRKFFNRVLVFQNAVYITSNDFYNKKVFIVKFNVLTDKIEFEKEFPVIGGIYDDKSDIYIQTEKGSSVTKFDKNLIKKGEMPIDIGNDAVFLNNKLFSILRNKDGNSYLRQYSKENIKSVETLIQPENIVKQNNDKIIIAGNNKTNNKKISLISYDVKSENTQDLKEFDGYTIVQGLQSNDKVICGLVGNIEGTFTSYDLFYSLDKGKTWQIQKLTENSYIRPSVLIDDILYIFSGGNRIQKISFN